LINYRYHGTFICGLLGTHAEGEKRFSPSLSMMLWSKTLLTLLLSLMIQELKDDNLKF
jgi:hypothetical protein